MAHLGQPPVSLLRTQDGFDQRLFHPLVGANRNLHEPVQSRRVKLLTTSELGRRTRAQRIRRSDHHKPVMHLERAIRERMATVRQPTVQAGHDRRVRIVQLVTDVHPAVDERTTVTSLDNLTVRIHETVQLRRGGHRGETINMNFHTQRLSHLNSHVRFAGPWGTRKIHVQTTCNRTQHSVEHEMLDTSNLTGLLAGHTDSLRTGTTTGTGVLTGVPDTMLERLSGT